jgi:tetratricopeptide (TPR) repeat protein
MVDTTATRISINAQLKRARSLESDGCTEEAIKDYRAIITQDRLNVDAYNRLMVLFRKQKDYKKEHQIIKKALHAFEKEIKENQREWKKTNRKSADLSENLAKALGLLDNLGDPVYDDPQMMTWRKRLRVVEQKLK